MVPASSSKQSWRPRASSRALGPGSCFHSSRSPLLRAMAAAAHSTGRSESPTELAARVWAAPFHSPRFSSHPRSLVNFPESTLSLRLLLRGRCAPPALPAAEGRSSDIHRPDTATQRGGKRGRLRLLPRSSGRASAVAVGRVLPAPSESRDSWELFLAEILFYTKFTVRMKRVRWDRSPLEVWRL